ncbi:MAG TPA: rhomboid family intramembrane serine protease [Candidatus Krumholzibacteria bacterium]|nr:rhomboid family intramembrane serine protease [Candidatus Krumholzibacteria bacterium]
MTPFSPRSTASFNGPGFLGTAVGRIIAFTVGVFFLQNLVPAINPVLALTPRLAVEHFFVWQIVTYMFLHGSFWHLFFNLIVLYFFGNMVEGVWGPRRFLRYYLACGIGGALLHMAFQYNASVVGASGAIFGVYLATAMLFPDAYVYLYFVIPVKVKYFVMGLAVLQLANGIAGPSGVAYFAHMGGMLAGVWFFRRDLLQRLRFANGPRRQWKAPVTEERRRPEKPPEDNIDSILDKISAKGYDNLTPTEKRILENYSRQNREGD